MMHCLHRQQPYFIIFDRLRRILQLLSLPIKMSPNSCTAARRALYNAFIKPALAAEPGPFLSFLLPREQYRLQSSSSYAWTPLEKSSRPFNDERSRDRQSQTQYTPFGGPRRNDDRAQSDYGDGAGSDRGVRIRRTGRYAIVDGNDHDATPR